MYLVSLVLRQVLGCPLVKAPKLLLPRLVKVPVRPDKLETVCLAARTTTGKEEQIVVLVQVHRIRLEEVVLVTEEGLAMKAAT